MADSLPDDLPVLPDDLVEYRLATLEDRDCNGWWQMRMEMRYLPR